MFLDALKGQNRSRPPIWLMRQAGRYLPEYQALREKYSLRELFFTPELAAQITLMPIASLGVDAAILFSDISVVALPLGFILDFSEGPVIRGSLQQRGINTLDPIAAAIRLAKAQLKVPLIGFCGGPFTVASYIQGDLSLLNPIVEATIKYIGLQEAAGVDAIQIFDSWADRLSEREFQCYCSQYLKPLIEAAHVPIILFMRGASLRVDELVRLRPDAISFDEGRPLSELRKKVPMAIQGNLDPSLLYEPPPLIRQKTKELLASMKGDPGFIVNLGHGIKPDVSVDAVRCLVDTVKAFHFTL